MTLLMWQNMYRALLSSLCQGKIPAPLSSDVCLLCPQYRNVTLRAGTRSLCSQDGGSAQPPAAAAEEKKNEKGKGKEGLLDLLGAMKVETTSKKRTRGLSVWRRMEPQAGQMESTTSMFQQATANSECLSPELTLAAKAAAETLSNTNQATSQLLQQLRKQKVQTEAQRHGAAIGSLITEMRVGKQSGPSRLADRNALHDEDEDGDRRLGPVQTVSDDGDGGRRRRKQLRIRPLNIFNSTSKEDQRDVAPVLSLTLWDVELAKEVATLFNKEPRNGFEEMIQWTREGKLWSYPIDNETGLEEEAQVPFHEHVFLEKHLQHGFPQRGPVRHFMELVVTGLAKNPYLSVRQKVEHIDWFREYFQQKEEILKEAEAC